MTKKQPNNSQKKLNPIPGNKPFQKGRSGNPNGRPKKLPELNVLLEKVLGEENKDVTAAEQILRALLTKAKKGDVRASELLLDRAWGKAKQTHEIDLNHKGSIPISSWVKDQIKDADPGK